MNMRLNWIATLAALALALAAGASDGSARHSPPARNCEAIDASANSLGRQDCDDLNALAARVAALEHSVNGETRADPTLVRRVTELEHWQSRAASRLPELQRLLEAIPQNGYEQFRGNIEATIRDARESFRTSLCGTWDQSIRRAWSVGIDARAYNELRGAYRVHCS